MPFVFLSGGNLTYEIPKGIADDCFTVDSLRGIVTTKGTFDRETKDLYTVPIYVMESMTTQFKSSSNTKSNKVYKSQFDVATMVVRITDVNDHAPEFRQCYPLAIPENSELSIVHQVVATDLDEGPNGDITYSITGKHFILILFRVNCLDGDVFLFSRPLAGITALPLTYLFTLTGSLAMFDSQFLSPTSSTMFCNDIPRNCFLL